MGDLLEEVPLREIIEAEDEDVGAGEYEGGGSGVMQEVIGGACSGDDGKRGAWGAVEDVERKWWWVECGGGAEGEGGMWVEVEGTAHDREQSGGVEVARGGEG